MQYCKHSKVFLIFQIQMLDVLFQKKICGQYIFQS